MCNSSSVCSIMIMSFVMRLTHFLCRFGVKPNDHYSFKITDGYTDALYCQLLIHRVFSFYNYIITLKNWSTSWQKCLCVDDILFYDHF